MSDIDLITYSISLKLPNEEREVPLFYNKALCERDTNWSKEFTRDLVDAFNTSHFQKGEYITAIKGDSPFIPMSDSICYVEGQIKVENQSISFGYLLEIKNQYIKVRAIGPIEFVEFCIEHPKFVAGVPLMLAGKPELLDNVWLYSIQKQTVHASENRNTQEQKESTESKKKWWEFWK